MPQDTPTISVMDLNLVALILSAVGVSDIITPTIISEIINFADTYYTADASYVSEYNSNPLLKVNSIRSYMIFKSFITKTQWPISFYLGSITPAYFKKHNNVINTLIYMNDEDGITQWFSSLNDFMSAVSTPNISFTIKGSTTVFNVLPVNPVEFVDLADVKNWITNNQLLSVDGNRINATDLFTLVNNVASINKRLLYGAGVSNSDTIITDTVLADNVTVATTGSADAAIVYQNNALANSGNITFGKSIKTIQLSQKHGLPTGTYVFNVTATNKLQGFASGQEDAQIKLVLNTVAAADGGGAATAVTAGTTIVYTIINKGAGFSSANVTNYTVTLVSSPTLTTDQKTDITVSLVTLDATKASDFIATQALKTLLYVANPPNTLTVAAAPEQIGATTFTAKQYANNSSVVSAFGMLQKLVILNGLQSATPANAVTMVAAGAGTKTTAVNAFSALFASKYVFNTFVYQNFLDASSIIQYYMPLKQAITSIISFVGIAVYVNRLATFSLPNYASVIQDPTTGALNTKVSAFSGIFAVLKALNFTAESVFPTLFKEIVNQVAIANEWQNNTIGTTNTDTTLVSPAHLFVRFADFDKQFNYLHSLPLDIRLALQANVTATMAANNTPSISTSLTGINVNGLFLFKNDSIPTIYNTLSAQSVDGLGKYVKINPLVVSAAANAAGKTVLPANLYTNAVTQKTVQLSGGSLILALSNVSGGTGFVANDVIALTAPRNGGVKATFKIGSVTGGVPDPSSIVMTNPGSFYLANPTDSSFTNVGAGAGTGLIFTTIRGDTRSSIVSVGFTRNSATFTNYVPGETFTFSTPSGGGIRAIATVTVVDGANAPTQVEMSNIGLGYTATDTITMVQTLGTGTGFTFTPVLGSPLAIDATLGAPVDSYDFAYSNLTSFNTALPTILAYSSTSNTIFPLTTASDFSGNPLTNIASGISVDNAIAINSGVEPLVIAASQLSNSIDASAQKTFLSLFDSGIPLAKLLNLPAGNWSNNKSSVQLLVNILSNQTDSTVNMSKLVSALLVFAASITGGTDSVQLAILNLNALRQKQLFGALIVNATSVSDKQTTLNLMGNHDKQLTMLVTVMQDSGLSNYFNYPLYKFYTDAFTASELQNAMPYAVQQNAINIQTNGAFNALSNWWPVLYANQLDFLTPPKNMSLTPFTPAQLLSYTVSVQNFTSTGAQATPATSTNMAISPLALSTSLGVTITDLAATLPGLNVISNP